MDLRQVFYSLACRIIISPFAWGFPNFISIKKNNIAESTRDSTKNTKSDGQNKADSIKSHAHAVAVQNKRKERE